MTEGNARPERDGARADAIEAAGVVVHGSDDRVVVVHRPRRDDWSLPKGKLDPGERHALAAVRECAEETGLRVALDAPLGVSSYASGGRGKHVHYWRATIRGEQPFTPNQEVDRVRQVAPGKLRGMLTYSDDLDIVDESRRIGPTSPLIVLRHAAAYKRADWSGCGEPDSSDDLARPLAPAGLVQADEVATLLDAYGVEHIVSSPARRCRQTVEPYAALAGVPSTLDARLSEEGHVRDPASTTAAVRELLADPRRVVLCTHRPVLHLVMHTLGEHLPDRGSWTRRLDPRLTPGQLTVLHRDRRQRIVAVEQYCT